MRQSTQSIQSAPSGGKRLCLAMFITVATMGAAHPALVAHPVESDALTGVAFFVAPDGNDADPGTREQPFATLARARDAIRELDCEPSADILVSVAPGDYAMPEAFVLQPRDSGRNGHRVVYRVEGAPGSARLLGGTRVSGWEPVDGNIFRARIDDGREFHALYENGVRAFRARFPNRIHDARFPLSAAAYLRAEDGTATELIWKEGDLDPIAGIDLVGATVSVWPWGFRDWHRNLRPVRAHDPETRMLVIADNPVAIEPQARYFLEGRREFLDQPGEFHLDRESGYLYYWPRFGVPDEQEIIAPRTRRIVALEGSSAAHPVSRIVIEGFSLQFTDAFEYMEGPTMFPWSETSAAPHGALHLRYADDVEIRFNHIKGAGTNGIYLERSNKRNRIYGNLIEDVGISGIVLAYHLQSRAFPEDHNSHNVIENNRILRMGSHVVDSTGVTIWGGTGNIVRHCEISDGARYGVSIRGPFTQFIPGEDRSRSMVRTNRPMALNNRIEYTYFHRLAQDSGDTAAMHMAGISGLEDSPMNFLEQLLFEDIRAHPSMLDMPPEAIYFDYTNGVVNQVLRDIEVRRTPNPFRTNRSDFGHTYDNVSWRAGFDSSRMRYDLIGLRPDFPEVFDMPREVVNVGVREEDRGNSRRLVVEWDWPEGLPPAGGVILTAEGITGFAPLELPHGVTSARVIRPEGDRLVHLRLRSRGKGGLLTEGVLVPAAEPPAQVSDLTVAGVAGGIELEWRHAGHRAASYRVHFLDALIGAVAVPMEDRSVRLNGLEDDRTYLLRVDVVDTHGVSWQGREFRATAGRRAVPAPDVAAWWSFDSVNNGIFPDDSGKLPFRTGSVHGQPRVTEGLLGNAVRVGEGEYLFLADPAELAIGEGDYAVSLWIHRDHSTAMAGRFLDFGGGSRGFWEHWPDEYPAVAPGLNISSSDYSLGALLNDGEDTYDVRAGGVKLPLRWNHIVVNIVRAVEMTLWLNGEAVASEEIATSKGRHIPAERVLSLGRDTHLEHPNLAWPGRVDQLRIYKRALSAAEIADLFAEGNTPGPLQFNSSSN